MRTRRFVVGMFAAIVAGSAVPAAAVPAAQGGQPPPGVARPSGCSDVVVLGVSGAGQRRDAVGPQVASLATRLDAALSRHGRTLTRRALGSGGAWTPVQVLITRPLTPDNAYFDGVGSGVRRTVGMVRRVHRRCPNQQIVLAGYSQGAMVVHRTLLRLQRNRPHLLTHLAGAVLIADGDRSAHTATRLVGTAAPRRQGIRGWLDVAHPTADLPGGLARRTWTVCTETDLVCDTSAASFHRPDPMPDGVDVHLGRSYVDSTSIRSVARRLTTAIRRVPLPAAGQSFTVQVGVPVSYRLRADVAAGSRLRWRLAAGSALPAGLVLDRQGRVSGIPTTDGAGTTRVQVQSSTPGGATSPWVPATVPWGPAGAQGTLTRLTDGAEASWRPAVSGDGRYVAFYSSAADLVTGDTNGVEDVFVVDTVSHTTTRLTDGNGPSWHPAISTDGRFVSFSSWADDLVPGDDNDREDVFVRDTLAGTTTRITDGDASSGDPSMSADGTRIAFSSPASNLTPGDDTGQVDVFVYDTQTGSTTRLTHAVHPSEHPVISADGRFVAFTRATLDPGDADSHQEVFLHDTSVGTTTRLTHGNRSSQDPSLSADGRLVAFSSAAGDLVAGDDNGNPDVFLYDTTTGTTTRLAHGNGISGQPSISGDGSTVAFWSTASSLVPGDTNGYPDVFVYAAGSLIRITDGDAPSERPAISTDGAVVALDSEATTLVDGDANGRRDVFEWTAEE